MNREQLFDIVRPIIMSVTGVPECILADPNAPSPTGEYCSVEPEAGIDERGQAIIRQNTSTTEGAVDIVVATQLITQCEINFYRGDARGRAKRLMNANKLPSVSTALLLARVGWNRCGPVNDLTALQADQREQRANVSIYLRYEQVTEPDTANVIESVTWRALGDNGYTFTSGNTFVIPTRGLLFNGRRLLFNGRRLTFMKIVYPPVENGLTFDGLTLTFDHKEMAFN